MHRNLLRYLLVAVMFAVSYTVSAQTAQKVTVSGLVTSAEDKQPLIGVTVVIVNLARILHDLDCESKLTVELIEVYAEFLRGVDLGNGEFRA